MVPMRMTSVAAARRDVKVGNAATADAARNVRRDRDVFMEIGQSITNRCWKKAPRGIERGRASLAQVTGEALGGWMLTCSSDGGGIETGRASLAQVTGEASRRVGCHLIKRRGRHRIEFSSLDQATGEAFLGGNSLDQVTGRHRIEFSSLDQVTEDCVEVAAAWVRIVDSPCIGEEALVQRGFANKLVSCHHVGHHDVANVLRHRLMLGI